MLHRSVSIALFLTLVTGLPAVMIGGHSSPVGCSVLPAPGDTERFVGISRSGEPPGALREWTDTTGRLSYAESWSVGADKFLWDGTIAINGGSPRAYSARRVRNGEVVAAESMERMGDSVIVVRSAKRSAAPLPHNVVPVPEILTAPVRMALAQCTLERSGHELETSTLGRVHTEEVASTTLRSGARSLHTRLFLVWTSERAVAARLWVDDSGRVIAYPGAEGVMDLVRPEWAGEVDSLLNAEVRASSPNCHFGSGIGSCEPSRNVCNLPTSMETPPVRVRSLVISDSGYSIRSDGHGAYDGTSDNVFVPPVGAVAGLLLLHQPLNDQTRFFTVDLNHPVRNDIGKPLGVIKVDGHFPGRFVPSGSSAGDELVAHANTDWDYRQHSLSAVPVGGSVTLDQLDLDFYINGVMHVLQMGPQPYGHCKSAGTAIYGDGTSRGTVSHPDPDRWVVDLPPGSIGRLFENRTGDPTAVNRGLYNVSLHLVIQK